MIRAWLACLVVVAPSCASGSKPVVASGSKPAVATSDHRISDDRAPARETIGELQLIFGPQPEDMILVHGDGSFEIVTPERTSLRGCGGVCPRRVDRFVVVGERIVQGTRELISRAADGRVDLAGLGEVTIDDDGVLVESRKRHAIDANGRLSNADKMLDVRIIGATTPELRRRAMLVLVFVSFVAVAAGLAVD